MWWLQAQKQVFAPFCMCFEMVSEMVSETENQTVYRRGFQPFVKYWNRLQVFETEFWTNGQSCKNIGL